MSDLIHPRAQTFFVDTCQALLKPSPLILQNSPTADPARTTRETQFHNPTSRNARILMIAESLASPTHMTLPARPHTCPIEMARFERGLIIRGAGTNTIRWSPPLILTKENVDAALEIFDAAIAASV